MDRRRSRRASRRQRPGPRRHHHFSSFFSTYARTDRGSWLLRHAPRHFRTPKSRIRPHLLQPSLRRYELGLSLTWYKLWQPLAAPCISFSAKQNGHVIDSHVAVFFTP